MASRLIVPAEDSYPWRPWRDVRKYVNDTWDAENTPHHSIIGLTGSGKSFLICHGLLDMSRGDRVLIIDTKNYPKGEEISRIGKPVKEFPKRAWYVGVARKPKEPMANWYRLKVSDDTTTARAQVGEALDSAYSEGDWIIVVDELWDLVSTNKGVGLGLAPLYQKIMRKGRSRHVTMIAGTQNPAWMPGEFYDQASFAWIGSIRDERRQKRLLEIGGMSKSDLPIIAGLEPRQWLLTAEQGRYFSRTKVVKTK